jgi:F-type H+-transporting ATPase subunit delta
MITPIAQKYASAVMNTAGNDLDNILDALKKISLSFNIQKTKDILYSSMDKNKIIKMLLDLSGSSNKKVSDFLHILASRNKLTIIPQILEALVLNKAKQDNKYVGYVYSDNEMDDKSLSKLQKDISTKLNKDIILTYIKSDFKGVRIDIDMLNLEISFSKSQIKSKLVNSILKAI